MDNSYVIRKERCPNCAALGKDQSSDNLAIYSDGHSYCYSCGFTINSNGIHRFLQRSSSAGRLDKQESGLYLPEDCEAIYPNVALDWVEQYELTRNDLLNNNVLWSPSTSRLIFPVYSGDSGLLAYQGRYFGPPAPEGSKPYPKWFGKGNLNQVVNVLGRSSSTIILTEDIISSIKISKFSTAMPLYGSHISINRWKQIKSLGFKKVGIFLDPDKRLESIKFSRLGQLLGIEVVTIFAEKDPKEIEYSSLKKLLDIYT